MKESDLIKAISNYLKTVPNLFFWKEHGGMYGTAGIPDLIICYKGRFIGLECKVGKNTATALQQQTIRQILKAGGYAVVVKSVGEVKAIIQAFEKEYYGRHQQSGIAECPLLTLRPHRRPFPCKRLRGYPQWLGVHPSPHRKREFDFIELAIILMWSIF